MSSQLAQAQDGTTRPKHAMPRISSMTQVFGNSSSATRHVAKAALTRWHSSGSAATSSPTSRPSIPSVSRNTLAACCGMGSSKAPAGASRVSTPSSPTCLQAQDGGANWNQVMPTSLGSELSALRGGLPLPVSTRCSLVSLTTAEPAGAHGTSIQGLSRNLPTAGCCADSMKASAGRIVAATPCASQNLQPHSGAGESDQFRNECWQSKSAAGDSSSCKQLASVWLFQDQIDGSDWQHFSDQDSAQVERLYQEWLSGCSGASTSLIEGSLCNLDFDRMTQIYLESQPGQQQACKQSSIRRCDVVGAARAVSSRINSSEQPGTEQANLHPSIRHPSMVEDDSDALTGTRATTIQNADATEPEVSAMSSRAQQRLTCQSRWSRLSMAQQVFRNVAERYRRGFSAALGHEQEPEQEQESSSRLPCAFIGHMLGPIQGPILGVLLVWLSFGVIRIRDPEADPDSWYQCMLPCVTIWTAACEICITTSTLKILSGGLSSLTMKQHSALVLIGVFNGAAVWCVLRSLWIQLGFKYPMPWIGAMAGAADFYSMVLAQWWMFSASQRQSRSFAIRYAWFAAAWFAYLPIIYYCYFFTLSAILKTPSDWQPAVVPVLLLLREASSKVLVKIGTKASGGKPTLLADLIMTHLSDALCSITMSVLLSEVSMFCTLVVVGADTAVNFYNGLLVLRMADQAVSSEEKERCQRRLAALAVSETIELTLPLGYLCCWLVSYYGSSRYELGNVGNSKWQYQAQNPLAVCTGVAWLAGFDAVALIAIGIALKAKLGVNIIAIIAHAFSEGTLGYQQAWLLLTQFCIVHVGCASDLSFEFAWVSN